MPREEGPIPQKGKTGLNGIYIYIYKSKKTRLNGLYIYNIFPNPIEIDDEKE